PKVAGSNPAPATKFLKYEARYGPFYWERLLFRTIRDVWRFPKQVTILLVIQERIRPRVTDFL
ncbi:MAG: hypothetical protein R3318_05100, partial [Gammaproteobacteria bacterium]|nr:hypothetical protein [Gammaproteobacteria bacterium]